MHLWLAQYVEDERRSALVSSQAIAFSMVWPLQFVSTNTLAASTCIGACPCRFKDTTQLCIQCLMSRSHQPKVYVACEAPAHTSGSSGMVKMNCKVCQMSLTGLACTAQSLSKSIIFSSASSSTHVGVSSCHSERPAKLD